MYDLPQAEVIGRAVVAASPCARATGSALAACLRKLDAEALLNASSACFLYLPAIDGVCSRACGHIVAGSASLLSLCQHLATCNV